MTGLVRKAIFLSACGMLIAGSAMAFVPSPVTSVVPCAVDLVGQTSGTSDVVGQFTIIVKDIAGNTIPNAALVLDFTGCCSDIRVSTTQSNCGTCQAAATELNLKKVDVTCDGNGQAVIRLNGTARGKTPPATPLGGTLGCMSITANGTLLTDGTNKPVVSVGVLDLDGGLGTLGLSTGDLSVWLGDFFAGIYYQRDDYDRNTGCAAAVGTPDLSKWLGAFFAGGSSTNNAVSGATCP